MCTVVVLINGKNSQSNVKNREGKLIPVLKEFGQACNVNKMNDILTHHSLGTVTHCPVIHRFHNHKITGSCSIDLIGYFVTKDYDG